METASKKWSMTSGGNSQRWDLLPGPQLASFFQVPREVFCWDFSGPLPGECKSHWGAPWTRPSLTQVPSTARGPRSLSCEVAGPTWRACQAPMLCIQALSSPPGLRRLLTHLPVLIVELLSHPRCPGYHKPIASQFRFRRLTQDRFVPLRTMI